MGNSIVRKGFVVGIILLFFGASMTTIIIGESGTENVSYGTDFVFPLRTRIPMNIHKERNPCLVQQNMIFTKEMVFSSFDDPSWEWAVRAGGTFWDWGWGVAVDTSENLYITGEFRETATFGTTTLVSQGQREVFVAKLNTNGDWQWAKSAGGTNDDWGWGIAVDTKGNTYITGSFNGTATFGTTTLVSQGESDVFVAKLNANGDWQWAIKTGGTSYDGRGGVAVDTSGNVYITGYFFGSATFGPFTLVSQGYSDVFITKLDTDGVWQWAVRAGGTSPDWGEVLRWIPVKMSTSPEGSWGQRRSDRSRLSAKEALMCLSPSLTLMVFGSGR
jgi:hypothetical protein